MRRGRKPVFAIALLALGGCAPVVLAPSPTVPQPTTTLTPGETTTTITPAAGATRFESCMRAFGVTLPPTVFDSVGRPRLELTLSGINFNTSRNKDALNACAVHLTSGALGLAGSPLVGESVMESLSSFSACVRGQGVPTFPDPVADFDGVGPPFPADQIPFNDPDLPDAVDTCRDRLG